MSLYGKRVDVTLLAKGDWERFLLVINWEKQPAPVDLSIALPEGSYELRMRDDAGWHKVSLQGKDTLPAKALKSFRRLVPPLKGEVYCIRPAEGK
jgi:hypothetical protein